MYYMRNAASSEFISSWQQRILVGQCNARAVLVAATIVAAIKDAGDF
jgi:hypothetical protein